jgi:sugar (pentulose or hexulose) kinase
MTRAASIVATLDIGGSAAKAVAYDPDRHCCVASAAVPYPAGGDGGDPGAFDPEAWWSAAVGALTELRSALDGAGRRCLGITVSAIRIPFVLVDRDGVPVMPGLLNRDRRAAGQVTSIAATLSADEIYRVTGHWLAPEFGLPKLLWARDKDPAGWRATRSVLQLHDWFIYRLCGVIASEPSSAAMSQMLSVRESRWADDLLAALDIPVGLMPELRRAGTRVGGLLPAVAAVTGFASGTPVHLGAGDTHMSAGSAGAGPGRAPVVVAGTTAPVQVVVDAAPGRRSYPLLVSEYLTAGQWALETNAGLTGGILARLADLGELSGQPLANELRRRGFTLAPGDGELTVLAGNPFFCPEGWAASPPPTVIGLGRTHRGSQLFRACLQAVCYAARSVLDTLTEHAGTASPVIVATGGMSRSEAWAQMLADATGVQVSVRPLDAISGRAGAELVTGEHDQGRFGMGAAERTFRPDAAAAAEHVAGYAGYRELYRRAQAELGPGQGYSR